MRAKPVGKNLGDDLDDGFSRLIGRNSLTKKAPFFRDESNQGLVKAPKIHASIVKLAK